jgi:hypothetical protein
MPGEVRDRPEFANSLFLLPAQFGRILNHGEVNLQIIPQTAEDEHKTHDLGAMNL